ncbi:hypothetical protein A4X13_0g5532 [Tilletia indica]|uniref:Uncharacterized protein n=1 Tax=Tilletia indica TaxID=43049 RepID=A0A177TUP3_9BASI|nr:hypothetical protein A4X13_0g5532 [Tilletia indica]
MSSNYNSPISNRTSRDAHRIRPSGSASSLLYFGPGISSSLLKPHQKRQRRAAANNAIVPNPAFDGSGSSSRIAALVPVPAVLPASSSALVKTPSRPAVAIAAPVPAPAPAPAASTPTRTASMMLDILKEGPQLPPPVLPRQSSLFRLAELGKESARSGRSSTTAQGAVSSPAQSARRAALRKELEEREKVKKGLKRKELDEEEGRGGDASAVSRTAAESGTGTGTQPPTKKRLTVLDIIERTAGSGGGLPARPNRSSSAISKTPSSAPASAPAPAGPKAATSTTNATSIVTPKAILPPPSTASIPAPSIFTPAPSIFTKNSAAVPANVPKAPAVQQQAPPKQPQPQPQPKPQPQPQLQPQPQVQPVSILPPKSSQPSVTPPPSVPTFDFKLDAVVQSILLKSTAEGSEAAARASALRVDQAQLPTFTFSL